MVVLSKLIITTAVVVPALVAARNPPPFDLQHVRFGHPVHELHEMAKHQKALEAEGGHADLEERHVPEVDAEGVVKHHLPDPHHERIQPRGATAEPVADPAVDPAADANAATGSGSGSGSGAGAGAGAVEPAHAHHKDANHKDVASKDAASNDAASPATPATPANAGAEPAHSSPATHKSKEEPDFFSGLLKLIFKDPNHVDKALSNGWDEMGKLFTGEQGNKDTHPAAHAHAHAHADADDTSATHKHSRRFEMSDAEELFERDFPEDDLELFERDLPEEDLELFERDFPVYAEELEARDFDFDDELMELAARGYAYDEGFELEARDFDDEFELEARDFGELDELD